MLDSMTSYTRVAEQEAAVMFSEILPTGFECGVLKGSFQPGKLVTHRFPLNGVLKAWDTFGKAAGKSQTDSGNPL